MPIPLPGPCTTYAVGHVVHFIQALHHSRVSAHDRHGQVAGIDGEILEVRFDDGGTSRYRNHETARLRLVLEAEGNRVAANQEFSLLVVPNPTGNYCFSVAADRGIPLSACVLDPAADLGSPTMTTSARPTRIVYGLYEPHDSFCLFEAGEARALADEYASLWACRTNDDLLALLPSLRFANPPVEVEDLVDAGDAPLDWQEIPGVADGDWPPMPTANALRLFSETDPIWVDLRETCDAMPLDTTLNGEYFCIPEDRETQLVAALARHGISAARDDALIRLMDVP